MKYSPQDTPVVDGIEQLSDTEQACIWVRDQGQGIRHKDQEKIFNRFYRINSGTASQSKGLGLGLYISNEIVTRQGGRMWLESKTGKGSTFYFSLPLRERS